MSMPHKISTFLKVSFPICEWRLYFRAIIRCRAGLWVGLTRWASHFFWRKIRHSFSGACLLIMLSHSLKAINNAHVVIRTELFFQGKIKSGLICFGFMFPRIYPQFSAPLPKKKKKIICFKGYGILTLELIYTGNYPDIFQELVDIWEYTFRYFK